MVQLVSLLKKNFIFWRRGICGCLCEMLCPILFAIVISALASLKTVRNKDATSYLDEIVTMTPSVAQMTAQPFPEDWQKHISSMRRQIMKNCTNLEDPAYQEGFRGGKIALSPKNDPIIQDLDKFFREALEFKTVFFDDIESINSKTLQKKYGLQVDEEGDAEVYCLGIIFDEAEEQRYTYRLMYNMSANPNRYDLYSFSENQVIPFEQENDVFYNTHTKNGHFYLQSLIDNLILQKETGDPNAAIRGAMTRTPTDSYKTNDLISVFSTNISLYIILPIIVIYLRFVYSLLYEKEHKITANLRNMGMSMWSHYLSWLIWYTVVLFVTGIVWSVILQITLFRNVIFPFIFTLYFLPGVYFIAFGLMIHGFFTKAKPGVLTALVGFFFVYSISIGAQNFTDPSEFVNTLFAISPIHGIEQTCQRFLLTESNYQRFSFNLMFKNINNFRYIWFLLLTIIQAIIFTIIGVYIDQVFPSEFGAKKHPLFCFGVRGGMKSTNKKQQEKVDGEAQELRDGEQKTGFFEEIDEGLLQQRENNESLEIYNLSKKYSNKKVAVDDLTLSMFSGQIFALLGHNGAGKTTTISMISGLLSPTQGSIKILGKDTLRDMDIVKTFLGVCPQTNPIYPQLTCYEHLKLYSSLKNSKKTSKEIEQEIDELLTDIDLKDKKNYKAGNLSGGQKRKLCVALAFIGGSKVILLDEPTSGMDTYARRQLWEMLKKYKKDRIIILTTHYMDEADFLGDRIGIMGQGKLLTCGSSLFLKNKYGIGYNLTIVKQNSSDPTQSILQVISNNIQGSKLEGDIGKELKFMLPTIEIPKFENLFKELEEKKSTLGIDNFGISLSTLEEVFLKVAVELGEHEKAQDMANENETLEEEVELDKIRVRSSLQIFFIHFWALIIKRYIYFKRDIKGLFCEIIIPILIITIGLALTKIEFVTNEPSKLFQPSILLNGGQIDQISVWKNKGYDELYSKLNTTGVKYFEDEYSDLEDFDDSLKDKPVEERLWSYFVEQVDISNNQYEYTMFFNSSAPHSMHIGINEMNSAILRLATGNENARINVVHTPFKNTLQLSALESTADGWVACFLFALAFSFIPSSMVLFIVNERESNAKHQQIVSGVSLPAYWLSSFLIDYIKYLIPATFAALAILIFGVDAFTDGDHYGMVLMLLVFFGPPLIAFTYLTSFMFKNPSAAQIFNFVLNFICGFILMTASFVMRLIETTRWPQRNILEYIYRCVPMFSFSFGLLSVANDTWWFTIFELDDIPSAWGWEGALKELIYLLVETVVFFGLIFVIEYWRGRVTKDKNKGELVSIEGEDEDVEEERKKVREGEVEYAIKVDGVQKHFKMYEGNCIKGRAIKIKKAVQDVSFGVEKGDCFGLLGTNGAGKTTLFKILAGEIIPTQGIAMINGLNVVTDMKRIRSSIGYCPQFDALLDKMTAREHLEFYAAIKGIPYKMRKNLIDQKINQLNLKRYENIQAGTYSGGNKRKLSVAMALLGNPPIVFLDEPSSGMDPEARRFMWSIVSKISSKNKKSSVILTTHSMEEAEALSTKLAIMVEGGIKCIGSVQRLKSKYGKGFEIETKLKLPTPEEIEQIQNMIEVQDISSWVNLEQIEQALIKVDQTHLFKEISKEGTGKHILSQIQANKVISAKVLVEYIHIQKQAKRVMDFMREKFGKVSILESYQSFTRFKIEEDVFLSRLFGQMEQNVTYKYCNQLEKRT